MRSDDEAEAVLQTAFVRSAYWTEAALSIQMRHSESENVAFRSNRRLVSIEEKRQPIHAQTSSLQNEVRFAALSIRIPSNGQF